MTKKWVYLKTDIEPEVLDTVFRLVLGSDYIGIKVGEAQIVVEVSENVFQEQIDDVLESSEAELHSLIAHTARNQMIEQLTTVDTLEELKAFLIEWLIPLEE